MSKKNRDHDHDDEKDLEDDEETERDEDEEEEEEHAAPAHRRAHAGHGHGDHGHDEDEEENLDDPSWWAPHAVMGVLIVLGVLGFFGVFNKALAGIAAPRPAGSPAAPAHAETHAASNPANAAAHGNAPTQAAPAQQQQEFGAKHFLVQYKGAMRAAPTITRTEDEAKARATEGMKKAKSGTKFEDVVKEYSDEPGAGARGGDLGTFHKGQMVPDFQNAVEKLKVGEISDLVKTAFGYHVILRTK